MQQELDPRVGYAILGVVALIVVGLLVWKLRGPTFREQTTGSEAYQRHYEQTGQFYQPPPGAPVPRPR
jgi:hypothetical protein